MRRPHGYAQIIDPDRPLAEYDTAMCAHCGKTIFVKPNSASTIYLIPHLTAEQLIFWSEEAGASCWTCACQPVCLPCHDLGVCLPLERRLAQLEGSRHA